MFDDEVRQSDGRVSIPRRYVLTRVGIHPKNITGSTHVPIHKRDTRTSVPRHQGLAAPVLIRVQREREREKETNED